MRFVINDTIPKQFNTKGDEILKVLNKIICRIFSHKFPKNCSDDCYEYDIKTITPYEAMGKIIHIIHQHTCIRCRYADLFVRQKNINVVKN